MSSAQTRTSARMTAGERREQLLDATLALIARDGFHAASIEAVAREAGITRPIVYGHFGDLGGLLEALIERETTRALGQLAAIFPMDLDTGPARDRLLAGLDAYVRAAETAPDTWRLVLMPVEGTPALLREQVARGREAVIAALTEAIGPLDAPDPELLARMLSALADEAARLRLTDPERFPRERILHLAAWTLGRLAGSGS
jgi:AcrR family transcriptional regulator